MLLKTKKLLAREFLLSISVIVITFLFFCSTYIFNYYKKHQVEQLDIAVNIDSHIADSLKNTYNIKLNNQESYFNHVVTEFDLSKSEYNTNDKLWERLSFLATADSIKTKWDQSNSNFRTFHVKLGYNNPESLKKFIESNILTNKEIANYNRRIDINKRLRLQRGQQVEKGKEEISYRDQIKYSLNVFIILFMLLFVFRYLLYIIIKSVKILKQRSE